MFLRDMSEVPKKTLLYTLVMEENGGNVARFV